MPVQFTVIRTINLVLDFLQERLAVGDTLEFIQKMTALQQELESWSASVNDTANDMNTFASEMETLDISSAYDVAVINGYTGSQSQWLTTLVGPQGEQGPQGVQGVPGTGSGYIANPWTGYTLQEQQSFTTGTQVLTDYGRIVTLSDNAIRYDWGTVADTSARDAITSPTHGDYVLVDGVGYSYYSTATDPDGWVDTGLGWIVTNDATDYGTVSTIAERDLIKAPVYGDYLTVANDSDQYHYYDGSAWVDTGSTSLPSIPVNALLHTDHGTVADTAARDAISNPSHGDYVIVTADGGEYHYFDGPTQNWIDTNSTSLPTVPVNPDISTNFGSVANTTERDALADPSANDYVVVSSSGNYSYYDGTQWVDTFDDVLPVVPADGTINPDTISTSWTEQITKPQVATTAELESIDWGNYPDGVYVQETGQTAYRSTDVEKTFQHLCGTSATAWASQGWVNNYAAAGQAMRVQVEVTADTYCRIGFQPGASSADSLMVEVQPTTVQGYDNFVAVGSPITVKVGDIVGLFRLSSGEVRLNINSVDVYTFGRSDTSAMNIYAYMLGVDDCVKYPEAGTDGNFLDPIVWDGYTDATMTEEARVEGYSWSYDEPVAESAVTSGQIKIVYRVTGQGPVVGAMLNKYPDAATVNVDNVAVNDVFTLLVNPGESITVDGTTVVIPGAYTNIEPVHFGNIGGTISRIGGN